MLFFSSFASATCISLRFWLFLWISCVLCAWPVKVMTLVLVLQHLFIDRIGLFWFLLIISVPVLCSSGIFTCMFADQAFCNTEFVHPSNVHCNTGRMQNNCTVLKYLLLHCVIICIADTFKLLCRPFVEVWIKTHTLWIMSMYIQLFVHSC